MDDHTAPPVRAKACEELAKRRLLRQVADATDRGLGPDGIADRLGVSLAAVNRMMRKVRLSPESVERGPREVALEYAVGEVSREDMLADLSGREYTYGQSAEPESPISCAYIRGSWDEVTRAAYSRLITDEDFSKVARRVRARDE